MRASHSGALCFVLANSADWNPCRVIIPVSCNFDQSSYERATATRVDPRLSTIQERRAGDIDMGPRSVANEFLQEFGRGNRAAPASFADVLNVRDLTFDLGVELFEHW